jgi:hypothetical protein
MRIRPIKPEFWEDEEIASWPEGTRLFYIGLWNIADDAGYFVESPVKIAGALYRYQPRARRERLVRDRLDFLVSRGKVQRLGLCGCAWMPSMTKHVRIGGTPAFTVQKAHSEHESGQVRTSTDKYFSRAPDVREGGVKKGMGGNGGVEPTSFREKAAAAGAKSL